MIDATMNVGTFWFMQNNQGKFLKNLPRRPEDYGPPLATIQDPGPQQDEESFDTSSEVHSFVEDLRREISKNLGNSIYHHQTFREKKNKARSSTNYY